MAVLVNFIKLGFQCLALYGFPLISFFTLYLIKLSVQCLALYGFPLYFLFLIFSIYFIKWRFQCLILKTFHLFHLKGFQCLALYGFPLILALAPVRPIAGGSFRCSVRKLVLLWRISSTHSPHHQTFWSSFSEI